MIDYWAHGVRDESARPGGKQDPNTAHPATKKGILPFISAFIRHNGAEQILLNPPYKKGRSEKEKIHETMRRLEDFAGGLASGRECRDRV